MVGGDDTAEAARIPAVVSASAIVIGSRGARSGLPTESSSRSVPLPARLLWAALALTAPGPAAGAARADAACRCVEKHRTRVERSWRQRERF